MCCSYTQFSFPAALWMIKSFQFFRSPVYHHSQVCYLRFIKLELHGSPAELFEFPNYLFVNLLVNVCLSYEGRRCFREDSLFVFVRAAESAALPELRITYSVNYYRLNACERGMFSTLRGNCSSGRPIKFSTLLIEKAHLQVLVTKQCYFAFSNGYMHSLKWLPSCNTSEEEWSSPGWGSFVFLLGYIMKSTWGLNFMWNNSMCFIYFCFSCSTGSFKYSLHLQLPMTNNGCKVDELM